MKKSILVLYLFSLAISLWAQGEVLGTVKDANTDETLPNATVVLMVDSQIVYHGVTDIQGNYLIKPVQPGIYDIQASSVTYAPAIYKQVSISSGQLLTLDFEMGPNKLGEVVVEHYKGLVTPGTTGDITIITTKEIESSAEIDVKSFAAVITPGIYQADSGELLRFRGARPGGTLYMMDGMRIIGEPYILQNSVGNMQVYTGGVPARYGDFTGGVIVIETKGYKLNYR